MIGIDQEPNRDALDKLNASLGEGQWTIEYRETANGVAVIVQTREVPARVWSSHLANGAARESVDASWLELTSRITASVKHDRAEQQTTAAESRAASSADDAPFDLAGRYGPPDEAIAKLDHLFGVDGWTIDYSGTSSEPIAYVTTKTPPYKRGGIALRDADRARVEHLWLDAVATWSSSMLARADGYPLDEARSLGDAPPIETIELRSEVHNPPDDDDGEGGER